MKLLGGAGKNFSSEYLQFKREMMPQLSRYEKWCKSLGNIIKLKVSEKDKIKIQKHLNAAHLDVTPSQTLTLAIVSLLLSFFVGVLLSLAMFFITGSFPVLLLFLILLTSLFLFYYFYSMPARLANKWRLKASSQMVPCVLYIVVYMKHTSNLERAIRFASQHLQAPLALDFKKIFWDIETGKYTTIKESLDAYLETWRGYSTELIESLHLVESSLYEPSQARRIATLERALQVILDGVYEKMLKYSREIRSPLTNLYMLGIILPTLGLALLPLASTLLNSQQVIFRWYHVVVIFNLIIPFFVFYLTNHIMLKRPGGYGETQILELNPLYPQYKSKKPYFIAFLICFPLLLLGLLPFIFQYTAFPDMLGIQSDYTFASLGIDSFGELKIFDFQEIGGRVVGPFGPIALVLSLLIPLSVALFFSTAYSLKSKELIKARQGSKKLEGEFTSSLFQLGNRIGDGLPAEVAFSKVAESSRGTATENFFQIVNTNLHQAGMSLEESIFNIRRGAIIYYPSSLIRMSMRILIESAKKGLKVAARSLMSISEYVKNIQKINGRLRDLLAEVVSDMKSNMTFLAPLLAGIVVGLASMITLILNKLQIMSAFGTGTDLAGLGDVSSITAIFDVTKMISPYFLQVAIGIYIIEIVFILTGTLVTVDAGEDRLKKKYDIARYLKFSSLLYLITALISVLILSILAAVALAGITA
jgi:Flp pilus assembly protein TadB